MVPETVKTDREKSERFVACRLDWQSVMVAFYAKLATKTIGGTDSAVIVAEERSRGD